MGECSRWLRAQVQILFTISSSGVRSFLTVNVSVRRDILGETRAILKHIKVVATTDVGIALTRRVSKRFDSVVCFNMVV